MMHVHHRYTNIMRMHFIGRQPFLMALMLLLASVVAITSSPSTALSALPWSHLLWMLVCGISLMAASQITPASLRATFDVQLHEKRKTGSHHQHNRSSMAWVLLILISNAVLFFEGVQTHLSGTLIIMSGATLFLLYRMHPKQHIAWMLLMCLPTLAGVANSAHWAISTSIVNMMLLAWLPLLHCTRLIYEHHVPCNDDGLPDQHTHGTLSLKVAVMAYAVTATACSILLFAVDVTGLLFMMLSTLLNARLLYLSVKLVFGVGRRGSLPLHRFAWFYLTGISLALMADHVWAWCV